MSLLHDAAYDDDKLAPVMPAIDVVQQLIEDENRSRKADGSNHLQSDTTSEIEPKPGTSKQFLASSPERPKDEPLKQVQIVECKPSKSNPESPTRTPERSKADRYRNKKPSQHDIYEEEEPFIIQNNPFIKLINQNEQQHKDNYEFIPKSVILDVYSNDPEIKRFLRQLSKICNESGYNEQDYKCYSCRRPIGLTFGQSRLCHFDGHHYCSECHLGEKSFIPARILCNWDFNKYPISKRNQHFLSLISNESMFELKKVAPLLYKISPELKEIEELRQQAFFIRSYCYTCVQDSVQFELTKLIWPQEHLIKQTDLYSLEDLAQIKNGALKQILRSVISFGKQHVLSCILCRQRGFICELCKSSQIIYPFNTESVHRCNECQSIYHKLCFKSKPADSACPRCQRIKARLKES